MINIKPDVLSALKNDNALTLLLGGQRIYQLEAPNATEFPRITFFEYSNIGLIYADDAEQLSEIYFQLDVFCRNTSTSDIAISVDRVMTSIGFFRVSANDLYEDLEAMKIYHKAMRYVVTK